jgi:undecaprenyl-phosphate 4-deoxy-4-formamido-L-arabinose transferase
MMRNYGQHNALLAGIRAAAGNIIATMDDDLQNPPEEIPKLITELELGHDVVYGTPNERQHELWRNLASQVTRLALKSATGSTAARHVSSFRVFRTHLRDAFETYKAPFVSIDVLLTWATVRFAAVVVRHDARRVGASNYTFGKLLTHAVNMMTGFSTWPLRAASLVGFFFTVLGACVLAFVVGVYIVKGGAVPGFPFLASVISIFAGAQMFALGIIGEYLSRMHFRMMERPTYALRTCVDRGGLVHRAGELDPAMSSAGGGIAQTPAPSNPRRQ